MRVAGFLLFYFLFLHCNGQQLNFRRFSFNEGLNTYNIQKVIQDTYGFIWVATQEGLYRYNGKLFESFRKLENSHAGLSENFIFDIYLTKQDSIYIAAFNGGIDVMDVKTLSIAHVPVQRSGVQEGLPNLWIKKVVCDDENNLWIGGKDYLRMINRRKKQYVHLNAVNVLFIKPLGQNTMAVGVERLGILLINASTFKLQALLSNKEIGSNKISDLLAIQGYIYLSTDAGIIKGSIINNRWKHEQLFYPKELKGLVINCATFDGVSDMYIGTNSGIGKLNIYTGQCTLMSSNEEKERWLEDNTINHLLIDKQKCLWISTSKVLQMVNLNINPFTHYSGVSRGSTKMDHVYSLVQKSDTEVFATSTDGLYITDLLSGKTQKVKGSGALGVVHYIMNIRPGMWMISSDAGMYMYSSKNELLSQELVWQLFPEWKPYVKNYFNTSISVDGSIFWASEEQEGLLIWNKAHHFIKKYKANSSSSKGLPENHIHNIKPDKEGNLWLLFDNSVAKYSIGKDSVVEIIRVKGAKGTFNSGVIFDLFDDGNNLWFGTYGGGLNGYNKQTKNWQYITEKDGLCNNCVYSILPEKDSVFWVSTNMGISRVNYITKTCKNYYLEDGLQDNSFDEKGSLSIGTKLFFGGINGFVSVDLASYRSGSNLFPAYINRIEYMYKDRKEVLNQLKWGKVTFPPKTSIVTVHLSALAFSNSRKAKFGYKLDESQERFLDVGDDNKIILNSLNAGEYELKIRYLNENGDFVNDQLMLRMYVTPMWYQTWWFKLLMAIISLAILYTLYRIRVNIILKEQKIRKKLASDLHDDLGSTLNSVKVYANLAIMEQGKEKYLHKITESIQEAIVSIRDLAWILNDGKATVEDVITRIDQFANPVCEAAGIKYKHEISRNLSGYRFAQEEKRNIYLIIKEAITNSIKHAGAQEIKVLVHTDNVKPVITIQDNGKGFSLRQKREGNGLINMKSRAQDIHYHIHIQSSDRGCSIELKKA